jgi:hypothetical protein
MSPSPYYFTPQPRERVPREHSPRAGIDDDDWLRREGLARPQRSLARELRLLVVFIAVLALLCYLVGITLIALFG